MALTAQPIVYLRRSIMPFTLPNHPPQSPDPPIPSDHPYLRQCLTPAPTTLPEWTRIPPEPSRLHEVWATGWNALTHAYLVARRALAAAGPDAVPAAEPDRAGLYTTTELFARAADAAELAIPRRECRTPAPATLAS